MASLPSKFSGTSVMREQWYADKRDMVKWAALIYVAQSRKLERILQIAFLQPSDKPYQVQTTKGPVPFPLEVWHHFRNLRDIQALGQRAGVTIEVFDEPFRPEGGSTQSRREFRAQYFKKIAERLGALGNTKLLVFLDPDTGIEPTHCGSTHVSCQEIARVFRSMKRRDWLAFYQHARMVKYWDKETLKKFSASLGKGSRNLMSLSCPRMASDVRVFAVEKIG